MTRGVKWRWASVPPTIPIFVGVGVTPYAFAPLLIWMFWWTWITFYIAIAAFVLAVFMALRGYTMQRLMSGIRHALRGRYVRARPWWYLKRYARSSDRIGTLRSEVSYLDVSDE